MTALNSRIDDHAVTVPGKPQVAGDINGSPDQKAPHGWVRHLGGGGDVTLRDRQKVYGGLGIDIPKDRDIVVLIDKIRPYLPVRYFAEDTIIYGASPPFFSFPIL